MLLYTLHPKTSNLKKTFYPQKLRIKNYSDTIKFNSFAIKTVKSSIITLAQLDCLRKILLKQFKKNGKF
jgi:hypothetical protein